VRIAIDYTPAIRQAAGIGRLTRHLINQLLLLDAPHTYRLFVSGPLSEGWARPDEWPANVQMRPTRIPERWLTILWHRLRIGWPAEAFVGRCDLFHATDFVLPPVTNARTIVTVHDLSFLRFPECAHPTLEAYLKTVVPRSLARADHVLADSFATKNDLVELLGVDADRVSVIYGGIEARFNPKAESAADTICRQTYDLDRPYILSLGTVEPRKNYKRLIRAYAALRDAEGDHLPQLVIAGGKGWLYHSIFATVDQLGLREHVRFLGYVHDAHLPSLYRGAELFVFPSLYEGFGFPPLEAMASGCPVVCSNSSSLPEVVGDAAITIDPHDEDALAAGISVGLSDSDRRTNCIERGLRRATQFTWETAAGELLELYAQVRGS